MTGGANSMKALAFRVLGQPGRPEDQDDRTVWLLRLGVGAIGFLLPIALIAGNKVLGSKVIIPSSMSGSYYTSTRNLFVGSLCALGVFLIFYRHTERQDRCTTFAGACALLVAFAPTAPAPPGTEPAWVNYLHHSAAGALIFTLGLFCLVVFTEDAGPGTTLPGSAASHFGSWVARAWDSVKKGGLDTLYLGCGLLVFISGGFALYTGIWPTDWSTGWPSLYLFEAVAVSAFGTAWIAAGLELRQETQAPAALEPADP
jgi:hypothetical protein